jgi:hypothetical protein
MGGIRHDRAHTSQSGLEHANDSRRGTTSTKMTMETNGGDDRPTTLIANANANPA